MHSWCTPGALLVHSWCTPGASWCSPGALLVHSWCTQSTAETNQEVPKLAPSRCHVMNSRTLLRRLTGISWHFTLPRHEQQTTAEKTNRSPSWNSTLPCHEQQSTAEKTKRCPSWHLTLPCHEQQITAEKNQQVPKLAFYVAMS